MGMALYIYNRHNFVKKKVCGKISVLFNIKAEITCFSELTDPNSFVTHFFFHSNS